MSTYWKVYKTGILPVYKTGTLPVETGLHGGRENAEGVASSLRQEGEFLFHFHHEKANESRVGYTKQNFLKIRLQQYESF